MPEYFNSLYAGTAAPGDAYETLLGDEACDVVIVGGGYTGISTALHLAGSGLSVVLLEAETIGWGASGRNGGQVNPGLYPVPSMTIARHGPDRGRRMIDFAYDAPNRVFDLVRRHAIDCDAAQTGTIRAAVSASTNGAIARLADECRELGMPTQLLGAEEMARLTGTTGRYRSALLDPRGGSVNPLGLIRGLARAAAKGGARIFTGSRALSLTREGQRWRVCTAQGTVSARHAVIGTNGYTDGLWPGLRQSVVPVYSAIAATAPLSSNLAASILPDRQVLYEIGRNTVYYRVDRTNRLLMGGRGRQRPAKGPQDFAHLRDLARHLFPALGETAFEFSWSGQVAMTSDHFPQLLDLAPNLHAALGYNGRGIAMATGMGTLLARRILGEPAESLPMPVDDRPRKIPFHRFWPVGVGARILYGALRDRFDR